MRFTIRNAYRSIVRAPAVNLLIVASLGIAIGGATTVFGWVEHLVRRPLPAVQHMERLVSVVSRIHGREDGVSYPDYLDWRDNTSTLTNVAAFGIRELGVRASTEQASASVPVWGLLTSGNYFEALGIKPASGRLLLAGDAKSSGESAVAVISARLAARWNGDPVGRPIRLNGAVFTVVGVAPPDFAGTYAGLTFDVWIPLTMQAAVSGEARAIEDRDFRWLQVFGRLGEGKSLDQARTELAGISSRLSTEYPVNIGYEAFVKPLDTGAAQRLRALFTVLLCMTGLIAAIVCTNVANLLMLVGSKRSAELRIRLSLGASPNQLGTQLLIESVVLALGGAATGVVLSRYADNLLPALLPSSPLPMSVSGNADAATLLFAVGVASVMVICFGIAPVVHTLRHAVMPSATHGRTGTTRSTARMRRILVVAQLALSMAALASAGAFLRVNSQLSSLDRGFERPEDVFVVSTELDQAGYRQAPERVAAVQRLLQAVRAVPGVRSGAVATFVPLGFTGYSSVPVAIPGYAPPPEEDMIILSNRVSAEYFSTLGIPIRAGRAVDERDTATSPRTAVVNEAFVRRFVREGGAVGRQALFGGETMLIVGVAADGKYVFDALDKPSPPLVYLPYSQHTRPSITLHARIEGDSARTIAGIRRAFAEVNPALPLTGATTLDVYTSLPLFPVRLGTTVLAWLGSIALLLASTGLYGVLAYHVAQRRKELAIRLALGASPASLLRLIVGDGLRQGLAGAIAGSVFAVVGTNLIASRLPRIVAADPAIIGASAALLLVVALLAALAPGLRAVRVAPGSVLKVD